MFSKLKAMVLGMVAAIPGAVGVASVGAGALVASSGAWAVLDVTGVTGGLTDAGTAIGVVALAMLGVAGAGIAVKWLLGFLFS